MSVVNLINKFKDNTKLDSNLILHENKSLKRKLNIYDKIIAQLPYVEGEGESVTLDDTIEAPFIELGVGGNSEQDGEPSPENKVDIRNATGNVNIKVENKNFFGVELVQKGFNTTTGALSYQSTRVSSEEFIFLNSGTYTINSNKQVVVYVYNESGYYIANESIITWQDVPYTFTLSSSRKVRFGFRNADDSKLVPTDVTNIQLYTPHAEQSVLFPLGTQRMYKNSYLADDGIHHKRNQVVFDGTEDWFIDNNCLILYVTGIKKESERTNILVYSNYFKGATTNYRDNITIGCIAKVVGANSQIGIKALHIFATVEDFKTYLAEQYSNGTPVIAEYELQNEVIEPYTETQQKAWNKIKELVSYYGQTNITATSDESSPIISAKAILDQNTLVTRINQLELEV